MKPIRFLSLFSGIGGMDLGLERAGMRCVAQVEIQEYHRRVLAKHWPAIPKFADIKDVRREQLPGNIDLIAGGFPCQDISQANPFGAGLAGARSGLWREFLRLIRAIRPPLALLENVPNLLKRGAGTVFADLAKIGYDLEWDCIPAAAFGAPHLRFRTFIVAHTNRQRRQVQHASALSGQAQSPRAFQKHCRVFAFNPDSHEARREPQSPGEEIGGGLPHLSQRLGVPWGPWRVEPDVDRVGDGISARMDRLNGLGNAVVPDVAEWIGRRIIAAFKEVEL